MLDIENTDLFREFVRRAVDIAAGPPDLPSEFRKLRARLRDAEKYVALSFPEYTPHDHTRHLDGLFGLADRLLGLEAYSRLGSAELALLVFGLYSHDWGMAVTEAEVEGLFRDAPGEGFEMLPGEPDAAHDYVSRADLNGTPYDRAWREYIRLTHAMRSGVRLRAHLESTSRVFADVVAKIAEGHVLDIRELRDTERYPVARSVFGESVNVAALATYVRIIDLLDIGDDRTPYALWKFVSPLNKTSRAEWEKHRALAPVAVRDSEGVREVLVSGWTDDPGVFAALADLRAWVESQFAESIAFIRTMPSKYHPRLDSRIHWTVEAVGFNPILVRFECERAAVLGLLSNELYRQDPLAFIRELLQNSVDAIDSRDMLLRGMGLTIRGEIKVTLRPKNGSVSLDWSDNGIGMDERILSLYFAAVGKSWYRSTEAQRFGDVNPISRFGVGVLSLFAVSEAIAVTTRRDPHAGEAGVGMIVEIPGRESYFRIQTVPNLPVGTEVRLTIPLRSETISTQRIISVLASISRFVRHSVIAYIDDQKIDLDRSASVGMGMSLSIEAMKGNSAETLLEACRIVDIDFGSPSDDLQGHYSALIPKRPDEVQDTVGYKEWLIGPHRVSLEDIVTDTEQSLFVKGIQVGVAANRGRSGTGELIGSRSDDWIPPKISMNILKPSSIEFSLDRSSARFASDDLKNLMWSTIAYELKKQIFEGELLTGAQAARLVGTCALFGGIPDVGLRALFDTNDTPLLVVRPKRGTCWEFIREFIQGADFYEAPFELGYASEKLVSENSLIGWQGENMLFPAEGCRTRRVAYLQHVLAFGKRTLSESGWSPSGIRMVTPPTNEPVPLVCRVWRRSAPPAAAASYPQKGLALRWNALEEVYDAAPQLLHFPKGAEDYAGIGSRYWNIDHPKVLAISAALIELARRVSQGRLSIEKIRRFRHVASNSFYGYTVPSRLSGRTLAIDVPNRLLALAEDEGFASTEGFDPTDFYPGTVGRYSNPYHYDLSTWETLNSDLGRWSDY